MTRTASTSSTTISRPSPTVLRSVFTAPRAAAPGPGDATAPVLSARQLRGLGIHPSTITRRCRPGGPWRRLAPGVVLLGTGEPTRHQWAQAAIAYLGPGSVITGVDALLVYGMELPRPRTVHALVEAGRRLTPPTFVSVERTARLPDPVLDGGIPFAPPVRAAVDAARREAEPDRLRALLTAPVREGLCTVEELTTELASGNQRGSAAVRTQLRRLAHTTEDDVRRTARRLAHRCPLPPPRWDVTITDPTGQALGVVDAWWDDVGLGWWVTGRGRERPGSSATAVGEQEGLALTASGVALVRTPPAMVRHHPEVVITELVRAFRGAARRPRPRVLAEVHRFVA
ncbi:hypothetical protein [Saccharomonospora piscinae]|uniref:hypothetical protein n=1 Tax=Saccharomonospora piscinae TaxID=687388 RepID=UPI00315A8195